MNPNMSIYRRLNPRLLLVQAGMGLGLLHWANMSNIYLQQIRTNNPKAFFNNKDTMRAH